jgi:hypothetical protein
MVETQEQQPPQRGNTQENPIFSDQSLNAKAGCYQDPSPPDNQPIESISLTSFRSTSQQAKEPDPRVVTDQHQTRRRFPEE